MAKLAQWPRFGRFISETLRLFPVTPILARLPLADDVIGGQPVAAGQNVLVSLIGVSHAGRSPADPWAPDLEAAGGRPVQGDVAFGLGPRVCGGKQFAMLELTAVLVAFLASARFTLTSDEAPRFRWKTQMLRAGGQPVRVELT